jgi:ferritin-like metal-binding protein YciE
MTLKDLLVKELKDLYDAELQLATVLPQLASHSASDGLRAVFDSHLAETRQHARRLEEVFALLGMRASGSHCAAVAGIVRESEQLLGIRELDHAVKDAALIAAAQKAEHYEMAGYGTALAWSRTLGLTDAAALLEATLAEENAADQALSDLAEQEVNISAQHEDASPA